MTLPMTQTQELVVEANETPNSRSRGTNGWLMLGWYLRVRMPCGDALLLYGLKDHGSTTWWYWSVASDRSLFSMVDGGGHRWFRDLMRDPGWRQAADLILATATLMGILE